MSRTNSERRRAALVAAALLWALAGPAAAAGPFEGLPPVVVATSPACGEAGVDPALAEIRATFSLPMATRRAWSWVVADEAAFPRVTGQPRFLPDGRTCVLPVKLAPGRTYRIWINSARHTGFRARQGAPARPYLLYFRTRP
jgi:RNA polymerase sigma-70 factor (ECF subfamily)